MAVPLRGVLFRSQDAIRFYHAIVFVSCERRHACVCAQVSECPWLDFVASAI
jgi:hypothetical protein